MKLKALVIRDDKGRFKDVEDVVRVARALGQQVFKTHENVCVKRIYGPDPEIGYVAVVEGPERSNAPGVRRRKKGDK
jgi:hypothetical protein